MFSGLVREIEPRWKRRRKGGLVIEESEDSTLGWSESS